METIKQGLFAAAAAAFALTAAAKPSFNLDDRLYAAPGLECNFYFGSGFESVTPEAYAFDVDAKVGRCESRRWTWTPSAADAGRRERVVFRAWNDFGLVASHTVTVEVASQAGDRLRKVTAALFADSLTNARYQDRILEAMRDAGWANYTPVGMRTGPSSTPWGRYAPGEAAHDGYGGFTAHSFLERYAVAVDEIDNAQSAAEREQLERFGERIPAGQDWRRGLLKSPLIRLEGGKKVVDVQMWLDRVNGGAAPDFLFVYLGINGTCAALEDGLEAACDTAVSNLGKLIAKVRAVAPKTVIAVGSCVIGCDQDAFGKNYGCKISAVQCHRNMFRLNRRYMQFVRELRAAGDTRVEYVPVGSAIDPVHGYIAETVPAFVHAKGKVTRLANAVHPSLEGGRQLGDAWAAWLLWHLGSRSAARD